MSEITVWQIVAYLFGIFGIITGPMLFLIHVLVGFPLIIAGLLVLPPTRKRIQKQFDTELSDWAVVGVYCSAIAASLVFAQIFQ